MAGVTTCPSCGAELPVLEGYMTWCHNCGWNVLAPEQPIPRTRSDRLYDSLGRRLGNRLAKDVLERDEFEPTLSGARVAAFAIAGAVFLMTLGFVVLGATLVVIAYWNGFADVAAVLLIGIAFLMRPRFGKPPKEGVVSRDGAPALYALADEVAEALGTGRVGAIVVDHHFNASWSTVGIRRTRVLTLGVPLLAVLSPEQRVALVAHEFAHARNGDSTHGLVVGSAVGGLLQLYRILEPEGSTYSMSQLGFVEPVVNAFFWLVSRPVYWLLLLEYHLLRRDSQRAEYFADLLASDVAGAAAVVALHERLLLASRFHAIVQHAALGRDGHTGLLERARADLDGVPERERERRRRAARLETARLSDTHPPTGFRIALIERRGRTAPRVTLGDERSRTIDAELARYEAHVEHRLVDEHRASLYA